MNESETKIEPARSAQPFVDDYFLYILAATTENAHDKFHAYVRQCGLKIPEWRVLACLMDEDGAMVTRLARLSLYEQSRLTKIIQQMETRGLLERRSDAEDARRVRMFLTDKGRSIAAHLIEEAKKNESEVLSHLDAEDSAQLVKLMKTLLQRLEQAKAEET